MKTARPPRGDPAQDPIRGNDGYPHEIELRRVRAWAYDDPAGLFAYLRRRWQYADSGYWAQRGSTFQISTGGWSGNEDLIGAMSDNHMFWSLCWVSSKRGGHYQFQIPAALRPKARRQARPAAKTGPGDGS
jgi:putative alpha-1,2-mannosidase